MVSVGSGIMLDALLTNFANIFMRMLPTVGMVLDVEQSQCVSFIMWSYVSSSSFNRTNMRMTSSLTKLLKIIC